MDNLEQRGRAAFHDENRLLRRFTVFAAIGLALILAVASVQFYTLHRLHRQTQHVLIVQIPGLEKTIADQQAVIDQAVTAISKLAAQVKELGGDPGQIILRPPTP